MKSVCFFDKMFTLCEKILEIIMIWNWKEGEVIKWGLTLIPYWRRGGRRVITLFFIFKGLDAFQKWIYPLPENQYFLPGTNCLTLELLTIEDQYDWKHIWNIEKCCWILLLVGFGWITIVLGLTHLSWIAAFIRMYSGPASHPNQIYSNF